MSSNVQDILVRFDRLTEAERAELQAELHRRDEAEWDLLSKEAGRMARERGIDDEAIMKAVAELR